MGHERRKRFHETDEFILLDREWQAKLKASGFVDIEESSFPIAHKRDLLVTAYADRKAVARGADSGLAEHYRRAGRWFHERVFPSLSRRIIWEMYAEGVPRRELVERMGTAPGHFAWWVGRQIAEERALMAAWYAAGGDPDDDGGPKSYFEEELAANGNFRHIPSRGEGPGGGGEWEAY